MSTSDLGPFLKARRGHVQPDDVGLRSASARRVPGLRREEVAMLAGVSVDYYARLEQGRERNPSPSVLNAIASALCLVPDQREHLFRLADLAPTALAPPAASPRQSLVDLLAAWPRITRQGAAWSRGVTMPRRCDSCVASARLPRIRR